MRKWQGVDFRKKYRIRIYNCQDSHIKLERKIKLSNYIHKDSASITRQEFDWIQKAGTISCSGIKPALSGILL